MFTEFLYLAAVFRFRQSKDAKDEVVYKSYQFVDLEQQIRFLKLIDTVMFGMSENTLIHQ